MKKTITLVAMAALLTTASFAQKNHQRDNDYGNNNNRDKVENNNRDRNGNGYGRNTYYFSAKERDMQIFSINREYSRKIESVRRKAFMGRSKKEQMIFSLEMERKSEIRSVIAKFNDRRNRYDRRDNAYNGRDKRNDW